MVSQISCGNIVIKFNKVELTVNKKGVCPYCDKKLTRTKTFYDHVSFFNSNKDGSTKTADNIRAELEIKGKNWQDMPVEHRACKKEHILSSLKDANMNLTSKSDHFIVHLGMKHDIELYFESMSWHCRRFNGSGTIDEFIKWTENYLNEYKREHSYTPKVRVHTEPYGDELVKSHIDLYDNNDTNSSCNVILNGVGTDENEAVTNAIKNMKQSVDILNNYLIDKT